MRPRPPRSDRVRGRSPWDERSCPAQRPPIRRAALPDTAWPRGAVAGTKVESREADLPERSEPPAHPPWWHRAFRVGIALKFLDGVLELIGGTVILVAPGGVVELASRLHDVDSDDATYVAAYLLLHGVTKVGLVVGLWRGVLWFYPVALVAFTGFLVWQLYELTGGFSWLNAGLSILDVAVIALTWVEWRHLAHGARPGVR